MRLIDADKLIDEIKNSLWDWESVDGITATTVLKQTITDIGNQQTIDAVPVVRCKDCVNRHNPINCRMYSEGMDTPAGWYCADGEKDGCQMKRPKETFWDSMSEADLWEPMRLFKD